MEKKKLSGGPGDPVDRIRVRCSPSVIGTELEGETVVLHLDEGVYSGFDETGTRIWQMIAREPTIAELRTGLLEEYEVSPEQCHRDLLAFLNTLLEQNLVETGVGTDT